MALLIELSRPVEERLQTEANRAGITAPELAAELLTKSLTANAILSDEQVRLNAPSIALLQKWLQRAQVPATPEQIAEADAQQLLFMQNMNAWRQEAGERLLYPENPITRE